MMLPPQHMPLALWPPGRPLPPHAWQVRRGSRRPWLSSARASTRIRVTPEGRFVPEQWLAHTNAFTVPADDAAWTLLSTSRPPWMGMVLRRRHVGVALDSRGVPIMAALRWRRNALSPLLCSAAPFSRGKRGKNSFAVGERLGFAFVWLQRARVHPVKRKPLGNVLRINCKGLLAFTV